MFVYIYMCMFVYLGIWACVRIHAYVGMYVHTYSVPMLVQNNFCWGKNLLASSKAHITHLFSQSMNISYENHKIFTGHKKQFLS